MYIRYSVIINVVTLILLSGMKVNAQKLDGNNIASMITLEEVQKFCEVLDNSLEKIDRKGIEKLVAKTSENNVDKNVEAILYILKDMKNFDNKTLESGMTPHSYIHFIMTAKPQELELEKGTRSGFQALKIWMVTESKKNGYIILLLQDGNLFWHVESTLSYFMEGPPSWAKRPYDFSSPIKTFLSLQDAQELYDVRAIYDGLSTGTKKGVNYNIYREFVLSPGPGYMADLYAKPELLSEEEIVSGSSEPKRVKVLKVQADGTVDGYELFTKEDTLWKWIPKKEYKWYPHLLLTTNTDVLKQCMKEGNPDLQQTSRQILTERAILKKDNNLIQELLGSDNNQIRLEMASKLVEAKDKRGISVLIELLNVPECYDQARAKLEFATGKEYGRGMVQRPDHQTIINSWKRWWEKNKDTFDFSRPSSSEEQKGIVEGMPDMKIPAGLQPYIDRLSASNPSDRLAAAYDLGNMREKAIPAIPYLVEMLSDNTMVDTTNEEAGSFVSIAAGRALEKIGKPAVEPLISAIKDSSNRRARTYIMAILAHINDPRAIEPLLWYATWRNDDVRRHAVAALKKLTGQDFGYKIEDAPKWKEWWEKNKASFMTGK